MNCPGSTALIQSLSLPETDEPEYRTLGTAAHDLAAECLKAGADAWEYVGAHRGGGATSHVVDVNMADAVQVYLDVARPIIEECTMLVNIEKRFHRPEVHPDFYGTSDLSGLSPERIVILDYKHGEGIVVEPEENPQIKYYALDIVLAYPELDDDFPVDLGICQPRAYHAVGKTRWWRTTVGELRQWMVEELIPAMNRTDGDLDVGKWCRFCPAKLVCPALKGMFAAAAKADAKGVRKFDDETIAREWPMIAGVKHYIKALEEVAYSRLNSGVKIDGLKLVDKQSKRTWKAGAEEVVRAAFGDKAFTKPELMSPAQLEDLGPEAKQVVKEWAYFPNTGLTVALESDTRVGVPVKPPAEMFGHLTQQGESK